MCEKNKPRPDKAVANLTRPMPLHRKLYLVMANNLKKIRKRQTCCGNHGQPGC